MDWNDLKPLAQCKDDHPPAVQALIEYAAMGPQRNLRTYWEEREARVDGGESGIDRVPYRTLVNWQTRYDWIARLRRYDELEAERLAAVMQEERTIAERARHRLALKQLRLAEELQDEVLQMLEDLRGIPGAWRKLSPLEQTRLLQLSLEMSRQEHAGGDKVQLEVSGPGGAPMTTRSESIDELTQLLRANLVDRIEGETVEGEALELPEDDGGGDDDGSNSDGDGAGE